MAPRLPCLAGIFAAVVVFLAGCGGSSESPSHRLGPPQDPAHATKISVPHVQLDASYVAYVASLCIESGTPIEPTGVELVKSSNMKIIDWGILDTASGAVGFLKGRLSSVAGLRHQPVQAICSRDSPNQLDVEVQISGPVAVSHGFQVNYRDGTKPGHLVTRLTLMLCSGTCPAT